jgi:hypothetical protein
MKLSMHLLPLLLVGALLSARAESPPPMLVAAEELLRQVAPEQTSYKHKEPEVRWSTDPANPAYCHTDCSGLIIALLAHCYPQQFDGEAFKRWLDARRPTARRFYDAIAAERGFRRIVKVSEVRPGDVIAVKYQPGGENTGHAMLIAEVPRRAEPVTAPFVDGTEQWLVTVIDETGSGHGMTDTRRGPEGKFRGGLGRGVFRLYARSEGTLCGYAWSNFATAKFYGGDERLLAIGRFDTNFKP